MLGALLLLTATVLWQDEDLLCLQDGRIFDGLSLTRVEQGIEVQFEHGRVLVPAELVLDAAIAGVSTFVPQTPEDEARLAEGLVPYRDRWMNPSRRDSLRQKDIEERRAAIDEMRRLRLWRNRSSEKTRYFDFEYTVPQHIFEPLRDGMEAYFGAFCKQWGVRQPAGQPRLKVRFYGDRESFHQVAGAPPNVLGYFIPRPPFEVNVYYDRTNPADTAEVLYHELNHYLQKLINLEFDYPHFPGEAIAEYYGSSVWDPERKKLEVGLRLEWRLAQIQADLAAGKRLGLAEMIQAADTGMFEHYTWGWSLVHYLMNDARLAKKFQKFVVALARDRRVERDRGLFSRDATVNGAEVWRLFSKTLGLKKEEQIKALEQDWHAAVDEMLLQVTPRGMEQAGLAAAHRINPPRPLRAKRLLSEAIDSGSRNPQVYHTYAELLVDDKKYDQALAIWEAARLLDPLSAPIYAGMAKAYLKQGNSTEAQRLAGLAVEIAPEVVGDEPLLLRLLASPGR